LDKDGAAASVSLPVPVDPAQKCENGIACIHENTYCFVELNT
jgi:hypothetical protein